MKHASVTKVVGVEDSNKNLQIYFDEGLHPYLGLGRSGFIWEISFAVAFGFMISVEFTLVGAWLVFGFCGVKFFLLYTAFRLNYRSGQWAERLVLSDNGLQVRCFSPKGDADRWNFEVGWLQVHIEERCPNGGAVSLSSHGLSLPIGKILTPDERQKVADAL